MTTCKSGDDRVKSWSLQHALRGNQDKKRQKNSETEGPYSPTYDLNNYL